MKAARAAFTALSTSSWKTRTEAAQAFLTVTASKYPTATGTHRGFSRCPSRNPAFTVLPDLKGLRLASVTLQSHRGNVPNSFHFHIFISKPARVLEREALQSQSLEFDHFSLSKKASPTNLTSPSKMTAVPNECRRTQLPSPPGSSDISPAAFFT